MRKNKKASGKRGYKEKKPKINFSSKGNTTCNQLQTIFTYLQKYIATASIVCDFLKKVYTFLLTVL
jgi:hypothetical protein